MHETLPALKRRRIFTFDRINRRTHLYLSMFFLPWVFVYGLSSAIFSHPSWFIDGPVGVETLIDRDYDAGAIPADDVRPFAEKLQRETGLKGSFEALKDPAGKIRLVQLTFWSNTQIIYDPAKRHVVARGFTFRWFNALTGMHTRGGFNRPGVLQTLWSVLVDVVQVSILIWVVSGLFLWWNLKRLRNWGWLALAAGFTSFAGLLLAL